MEITCLQMDVLISFYIDGELNNSLKEKVEQHLQKCPSCRAKFNIINSNIPQKRVRQADTKCLEITCQLM